MLYFLFGVIFIIAESIFGEGTVAMSGELDHQGADFQVRYKGKILNYQVKKKSFSGEVRRGKGGVKNKIEGEFIDINYHIYRHRRDIKRNGGRRFFIAARSSPERGIAAWD